MVRREEAELQDLGAVVAVALDRGIAAEALHLRQVDLTALSDEPHFEGVGLLRLNAAPEAARTRRPNRDRIAHVPLELEFRIDFAKHGEHPRQHRTIPTQLATEREALLREVPLLAVLLPRHLRLDAAGLVVEPTQEESDRLLEEALERRRVDLVQLVNDEYDLLPAGRGRDFDAVAVARKAFEPRRIRERLQAEFRLQQVLFERPTRQAEDELHVRFVARHRVEEPAVRLLRRGDLDDAAIVPVGI